MNAKHQFKYTYSDTNLQEFSPVEVTFDMPGDVTINQMLYNFESYLKACGFYFDGHLEIVDDTLKDLDLIDELDGTLYEFEDEPEGGCMSDFDKECGCEDTSSPLETSEWNNQFDVTKNTSSSKDSKWSKAEKMLKEWNEGIAKLDNEIKTQRKVREMANKSADMVKDFNDAYEKLTHEQKMKAFKEACTMSGLHDEATKEVKKNNWVHGMCNPPAYDAKEYVKDCKSTGKKYNSVDAMLKGLMKKHD